MSYTNAATLDEIAPGTGKLLHIEGVDVAVLRDDEGNFYAMENECPHAGYTMAEGIIEDGCVECFAHGARFDLVTGEPQSPAHRPLKIYSVKVEGNNILVDISA